VLHPAREIWKLQTGSVKLGHLEERVLGAGSLGWSRLEEIDSAMIPGIYFDYVYGRAQQMESVFRHNRMDLRGLAALAGRVLQMLSTGYDAAAENAALALELYGVARFFGRRGQHAKARRCCEIALHLAMPSAIAEHAEQDLARFIQRELRKARTPARKMKRNQSAPAARRSIPR
jgi:RNase_H superfamily